MISRFPVRRKTRCARIALPGAPAAPTCVPRGGARIERPQLVVSEARRAAAEQVDQTVVRIEREAMIAPSARRGLQRYARPR